MPKSSEPHTYGVKNNHIISAVEGRSEIELVVNVRDGHLGWVMGQN